MEDNSAEVGVRARDCLKGCPLRTGKESILRQGFPVISHLGRKTVASAGLLTSLDMFEMMTAVLRLMGVSPWRIPRISNGTMMASAGASTD